MKQDLKKDIITKAWNTILDDSKIKKLYFFPWLVSIIFFTLLLVYQVVYTYVEIFDWKEQVLTILLNIFHSTYIVEIIILALVFLVIYIITIPIFEWGLIYYLDNKEKKENISSWDIISSWLYKFLPVFEYNNIFSQFKLISILNIYLFCLRFIWLEYIWLINYIFLFLFLLSVIINILFAYSKYEIILNKKKALESITSSIKISILNIWLTSKLYIFMFLLNIRVIINFLVFLIFPIIIISAIIYITSKIFLIITLAIFSIIFLFLILFLWYLSWVLDVFKTAIWYYAYKEAKEKSDNIDKEE